MVDTCIPNWPNTNQRKSSEPHKCKEQGRGRIKEWKKTQLTRWRTDEAMWEIFIPPLHLTFIFSYFDFFFFFLVGDVHKCTIWFLLCKLIAVVLFFASVAFFFFFFFVVLMQSEFECIRYFLCSICAINFVAELCICGLHVFWAQHLICIFCV